MTRHTFLPPLVLALVVTVACGGKSPTTPSPPPSPAETPAPSPAPAVPTGSATIGGQVVAGAASLGASAPLGLAGVTVSVAGTSISTVGDGSGHFSLSNVPGGDQRIEFHGNGANATVSIDGIAEQEHIDVTVAVTGSTAQVVEQERVTGAEAQLEGAITAKSEAARTLEVRGVTVKVPTGVPIMHGSTTLTFANLHTGDRVHVKGAKDSSGITASQIEVQHGEDTPGNGNGGNGNSGDDNNGDDNGNGNGNGNGNDDGNTAETSLSGTPSGMTGTCPTLTFMLQGKTVKTSATTDFSKGTCDAFRSATSVEAEGVLSGNTLDAKKVSIEKD